MSSVDVITPCYRYARFLRQCVESALSQSLRDIRVLIIDDASPDDTNEIASALAKEDPRVEVVQHATNKGHIAAFNEGIEWATAKYLLVLSADDYLLPGALARAVELMDAHPEVGFTYGKQLTLHDGDDAEQVARAAVSDAPARIVDGPTFIELGGARNIVPTPTVVVRTELQKQVGGYRPELPHSGDMEMWLRLAAHSRVGILDAHQAVYRRHGANMSLKATASSMLPDLEQRRAALDAFLGSCSDALPDAPELRRRLFRSLGRDAIRFASIAFNEGDTEACSRISDFAVAVSPPIRRSLPWLRLACKRRLGFGAWRALQSVVRQPAQHDDGQDGGAI
jgi:Glycosyl transferase family 2